MARRGESINSSTGNAWELHLGIAASGHLLLAPAPNEVHGQGQELGGKSRQLSDFLLPQGRPRAGQAGEGTTDTASADPAAQNKAFFLGNTDFPGAT